MSNLLFSPVSAGGLELKNRVVISPMCQYSADQGRATDWHVIHYGQFALSGAGLLIFEATAVSPEGRISPQDLGLWSDETEEALGKVMRAIRAYSSMPVAIQLGHAGRKASQHRPWESGSEDAKVPPEKGGWRPVAPSPLPYTPEGVPPEALDGAGLDRVRSAFAEAARRADRLGFDAVEVHSAHGYLLHQFLSPLSNKRTDDFGGPLENRMRFPLSVFDAVREAFPAHKPVGLRLSGTDWAEGGWDIGQSVLYVRELQKRGCAYAHVSSGGLTPAQKITPRPGYQIDLAARVRRETGIPAIGVGLITEAVQAENILVSGQADMVALGRAMLYDPRWPWHAAAQLGASVDAPPQYWRSQPHGLKGLFNPEVPGKKP